MKIDFKQKIFSVVKKIPKGKFLTYKKVATLAGRPKAWRAVGNILNKNNNPEIPCHRVIKSDGSIGGYNKGSLKKIYLLIKEGVLIKGNKKRSLKTKKGGKNVGNNRC